MSGYKYLGDFSATPPWHSITLYCDPCGVKWTGCFDANQCPKCGNAEDFYGRTQNVVPEYSRAEGREEGEVVNGR